MIKAIIFDFGNVIYKFDNNIFLHKISKYTNKSFSELNKVIYQKSNLCKRYETGLITSDQFFRKIIKCSNLKISRSEFIKTYTNIFTPIPTTIKLIKKLKNNYKISLLSDTSYWDYYYGIKSTNIFKFFDTVSLSFRIKKMKPSKKIFLDVLKKLKLRPKECVYIDDIKKYTLAAQIIGFNTIHYTSHYKLINSLKKLNIKL